jgi:hypothetical protein
VNGGLNDYWMEKGQHMAKSSVFISAMKAGKQ